MLDENALILITLHCQFWLLGAPTTSCKRSIILNYCLTPAGIDLDFSFLWYSCVIVDGNE